MSPLKFYVEQPALGLGRAQMLMNETPFQVVTSYFKEFLMSPVAPIALFTSLWATDKGNFISTY